MINGAQFVAGGSAEIGVLGQHLDGELYLVDDALAGAVPTVKKFEVLDSIVGSDAVNVMHGFVGREVAADVFRHDVAMFHDGVFFTGHEARNRNPNVTMTFNVTAYFATVKFVEGFRSLVFGFAFLIAVFLLSIGASAWLTAFGIFFAAFYACKNLYLIGEYATSLSCALYRAIHRFMPEPFVVGVNVRAHHDEWFRALFARKMYGRASWRDSSMSSPTFKFTEFSIFAWVAVKRLLAAFTDFLNQHVYAPLLGGKVVVGVLIGEVK